MKISLWVCFTVVVILLTLLDHQHAEAMGINGQKKSTLKPIGVNLSNYQIHTTRTNDKRQQYIETAGTSLPARYHHECQLHEELQTFHVCINNVCHVIEIITHVYYC